MNKLSLIIVGAAAMLSSFKAAAYTADDFVGNDKFCTQMFYCTEMISSTPLPQESGWGRFERVESDNSKIRLTSFKNGGAVTFTITPDGYLSLDGTDTSDGAQTTDANGKTIYLRPVTHHTDEVNEGSLFKPNKQTYHYFIDNSGEYKGRIMTNADGTLTVTFDSSPLCFRARTSDAVNVGNYDAFQTDFINTFNKCVLNIYPQNGTMTAADGSEIPTYEYEEELSDYKIIHIKNYCGYGENFSVGDGTSTVYPQGIKVLSQNGNTSMSRQVCTGKMDFEANRKFKSLVNGGKGSLNVRITAISYSNKYVEGNSGTLKVAGYDITPGWHKKYAGGSHEVIEHWNASSQWRVYDDNNKEIYPMAQRDIKFWTDVTPDATITGTEYYYNNDALLVAGTLGDIVNPEAVESYDIYMIGGEAAEPDGELFETSEKGHTNAILVTEKSLRADEELGFARIFTMSEIQELGFDPYDESVNNTITLYVRFNLKNGQSVVSADAPRRAEGQAYSFSALTPTPFNVPTSVNLLDAAKVSVSAHGGIIRVNGSLGLNRAFDASGAEIYSGTANEISVAPGLYIVKTPVSTHKILVK